jgi:hypothetical protein
MPLKRPVNSREMDMRLVIIAEFLTFDGKVCARFSNNPPASLLMAYAFQKIHYLSRP